MHNFSPVAFVDAFFGRFKFKVVLNAMEDREKYSDMEAMGFSGLLSFLHAIHGVGKRKIHSWIHV